MKSARLFAGLALTALAIAGPAAAQRPAAWTQPYAPFRIIDNIYYVGTAGLSSFLITDRQGHILIDGGLPESAPIIQDNIRKLGFRLDEVKVIVNSHAHFDHSGGLAQLKKDTGAVLVSSEGDKGALESGKYLGSEDVRAYDAPPVKVDQVIKDGQIIGVGEISLAARLTPGHTKGCTTWLTPVRDGPNERLVAFFCSASVAANRLAPNPQYPGIVEDYQATFAKARTIGADVFLAPHPDQFDLAAKRAKMGEGKPNPFVDKAELARRIDAFEADFKVQLARQQGAAR